MTAKKNSPEESLSVCSLFGGRPELQARFQKIVRNLRESKGLTHDEFDRRCRFGDYNVQFQLPTNNQQSLDLPGSAEYEADPSLLTGQALSTIMQLFHLESKVRTALGIDEVSARNEADLIREMRESGYSIQYTLGGKANPVQVADEKHIPLFVMFRLLHELSETQSC